MVLAESSRSFCFAAGEISVFFAMQELIKTCVIGSSYFLIV